jgi:hypothetical protein
VNVLALSALVGAVGGVAVLRLNDQSQPRRVAHLESQSGRMSPELNWRTVLSCCGLKGVSVRLGETVVAKARSSSSRLDYVALLTRLQQVRPRRHVVAVVTSGSSEILVRAELSLNGHLSAQVAQELLRRRKRGSRIPHPGN